VADDDRWLERLIETVERTIEDLRERDEQYRNRRLIEDLERLRQSLGERQSARN
jgi:hypothetical protein